MTQGLLFKLHKKLAMERSLNIIPFLREQTIHGDQDPSCR